MARLLPLALLVSLALAPGRAQAQNAPQQAEARTLFEEGARLYQGGSYAEACAKLEASYHLFAGIGTRGKLAECYEKVGRTASAWAMYQEVAALASKAGDERRVDVAKERAAALLPILAHLTVVLPPLADLPGLEIKRGNEGVERGAIGSAIAVDPSKITFVVSAPGYVTKTVDLTVAPKEQATFTVPVLDAVPPAAPSAPERSSPATPAAAQPTQAAAEPAATWPRPVGIAVAGAGVVTIGIGVALAMTAKASYDGAFNGGDCTRATLTCNQSGQSQTGGARSQADVGGVLMGVGGVMALGGGALFFFAGPGGRGGSRGSSAGVRIAPVLGPSAFGLSLTGAF